MAQEHVFRIDRLAAHLAVKVHPTGGEAASLQNQVHDQRRFRDVVGELVGVPLALHVAAVHVDGAKYSQVNRRGDFMFETVAGQRGVVGFDVDLDFLFEPVLLQEAKHRSGVKVVLVLGRLTRFGFNQDGALEADLVLVFDHHIQEATHLVQLLAHARVEQGFVAFAAAPQHIVFAAEFERGIHGFFYLQGSQCKEFRVGVGGRSGHKPSVAKQIGRAPQKLHARVLLLPGQHIDHGMEVGDAFARRVAFGRHVAVMKTVVRCAQFGEELKGRVGLGFGRGHGVAHVLPGTLEAVTAKGVASIPAEAVPIAHGKTQVVFHALAGDDAVLVVPLEGQGVFGVFAFKGYGGDGVEIAAHGVSLSGCLVGLTCWVGW